MFCGLQGLQGEKGGRLDEAVNDVPGLKFGDPHASKLVSAHIRPPAVCLAQKVDHLRQECGS